MCVSEALPSYQGQKGADGTTEGWCFTGPFVHLDSRPGASCRGGAREYLPMTAV